MPDKVVLLACSLPWQLLQDRMICYSGVLAIDMHLSVLQSDMLAQGIVRLSVMQWDAGQNYIVSICAAVECWPKVQCVCLCCSGMLPLCKHVQHWHTYSQNRAAQTGCLRCKAFSDYWPALSRQLDLIWNSSIVSWHSHSGCLCCHGELAKVTISAGMPFMPTECNRPGRIADYPMRGANSLVNALNRRLETISPVCLCCSGVLAKDTNFY